MTYPTMAQVVATAEKLAAIFARSAELQELEGESDLLPSFTAQSCSVVKEAISAWGGRDDFYAQCLVHRVEGRLHPIWKYEIRSNRSWRGERYCDRLPDDIRKIFAGRAPRVALAATWPQVFLHDHCHRTPCGCLYTNDGELLIPCARD